MHKKRQKREDEEFGEKAKKMRVSASDIEPFYKYYKSQLYPLGSAVQQNGFICIFVSDHALLFLYVAMRERWNGKHLII